MNTYDVIVLGLGAMGSAATYQLAKAGVHVLGIDQYSPPHTFGSSHGDTRITRLAIGEDIEYSPIVKRSHELWREIGKAVDETLLVECGELLIAAKGAGQHGVASIIEPTYTAAEKYNIAHEKLSGAKLQARFPQFNLEGSEDGYYEPGGGYVWAEKCVRAQLTLAKQYGAQLHTGEKVLSYKDTGEAVEVTTGKGTYAAQKLIIAAGPWVQDLVPEYASLFKIYRQVLYWFDLEDENYYEAYKNMPVFIWLFNNVDQVYGFPAVNGKDGGIKLATEQYLETTHPGSINRTVSEDEIRSMYEKYIEHQLPGVSNRCIKAVSCMYTSTPDSKFIIDYHPAHRNVIVASPCSGHGFKHSAAIGEILSQLATKGKSDIDISRCSFGRLLR